MSKAEDIEFSGCLQAFQARRPPDSSLRVLILSDDRHKRYFEWVRSLAPDVVVEVVSADGLYVEGLENAVRQHRIRTESGLVALSRRVAAFDLIIDDVVIDYVQLENRIPIMLSLLLVDGFYICRIGERGSKGSTGSDQMNLRQTVLGLSDAVSEPTARMISEFSIFGRFGCLRKRMSTMVKITEGRASDELCSSVGSNWWSQRQVRSGYRENPEIQVFGNKPSLVERRLKEVVEFPRLMIREYKEVCVWPRQIVFRGSLLLPESFRLFRVSDPKNSRLTNVDSNTAVAVPKPSCLRWMDGTYLYLGSEHPDAFGHALNEVCSRLWAWDEVLGSYPDAKVLVSARADGSIAPWLKELLAAFGIDNSRIVVVGVPVVVERLIGATPGFTNSPHGFADPVLNVVWERILGGMLPKASLAWDETYSKIFVTRGNGADRECRNKERVESLASSCGFRIVRPEQMSLADQALMFSRVEHLAGFGGSGLINALYARNMQDITVIAPETYSAVNEYQIARLKRANVNYFWEKAEVQYEPGVFSLRAFHSPYTFDFENEGDMLKEALVRGTATR